MAWLFSSCHDNEQDYNEMMDILFSFVEYDEGNVYLI